jgi:hypothetical protein
MFYPMMRLKWFACLGLAAVTFAPAAFADPLAGSEQLTPGYSPPVPVSVLARPLAWFDPSRLHISSQISVGSSFGAGQGAQTLQVTSFNYNFGLPLEVGVRVGNTFGTGFGNNASSSFFLEGLDVTYRPTPNMTFEIHTRDLRSPLQYRAFGDGPGYWGR